MRKNIHPDTNYRIDLWFPNFNGIERELAFIDDYELAALCYWKACRKFPKSCITFRQGMRVINERDPALSTDVENC